MRFWEPASVLTMLLVCALLLGAYALRMSIGPLKRVGIPDSMVAGFAGLLLGPAALGLLPMDTDTLEMVVYHGLALIFIAVGLQSPQGATKVGGARAVAFMVPTFAALQCIVGLLIAIALGVHVGFGVLLPLGFQQGPGQALSLGEAWEATGLVDGGQIGLIMAAIGFAWAVFIGVPLVAVARKLGWLDPAVETRDAVPDGPVVVEPEAEGLASQPVIVIGSIYLLTCGVLAGLAAVLPEGIVPMVYGFHFIVGVGLAIAVRKVLSMAGGSGLMDNRSLRRTSALVVDFVTCSALAAVQLSVLGDHIVPIVLITTVGGGVTMLAALWLGKRAFHTASFQHALVMFGTVTGTLPTGLALLRMVNPKLEGPAPTSAVLGSAAAVPLAAPLVVAVFPIPVTMWPNLNGAWLAIAICALYIVVLMVVWWKFFGLRFVRPLTKIWPS